MKHCKQFEDILNGKNKELADKLRTLLGETDNHQQDKTNRELKEYEQRKDIYRRRNKS